MSLKIDREFPKRVTNSSLVLGLVLFLFLYGVQLERWALGFGVGAALSIFSFEVLRIAFRAFIRTPEEKEKESIQLWEKITLAALLLLKLPLWIAVLYLSIHSDRYSLVAILLGIAITQLVMVLKVVSLWLTKTEQEPVEDDNPNSKSNMSLDPNNLANNSK